MKHVKIISITPEQLEEIINNAMDKKLADLKEHFQPKEPAEWLTRYEVRDLLKINLTTLHVWTKKGKLKPYGLSHRVYYKRHEVEQALVSLSE